MKTFVRNFIGPEVARIQIASKKCNLKIMAKKTAQRREKGTAEEAIWMPAPRSFIRSKLVLTSKSQPHCSRSVSKIVLRSQQKFQLDMNL